MCGCMLMHAAMNHSEHQAGSRPGGDASIMDVSGGQRCAHCDFPLQSGFAYCPNCGMSLQAVECPSCGQKVEATWKSCAYCGSPLGEEV
jgi:hypothetical protein